MWVLRAAVMTLLHAGAQTAVAVVRATAPEAAGFAPPVAIAVLVAAAAAWAAVDGRMTTGDAAARGWFVAALVTGPAAGVFGLIGRGVLVDATGVEALGTALIGGAAFTALLVLFPAMAGLGAARLPLRQLAGRERPASQRNASA